MVKEIFDNDDLKIISYCGGENNICYQITLKGNVKLEVIGAEK